MAIAGGNEVQGVELCCGWSGAKAIQSSMRGASFHLTGTRTFFFQAMVAKMNDLLVKTVKAPAIKRAHALVSFDPSRLQTSKMAPSAAIKDAIPLVDTAEYERYVSYPAQQPPLLTTQGQVDWWRSRLSDFPKLAPLAIAFLLTPRSSCQAERTFSLLGHGGGDASGAISLLHTARNERSITANHSDR